MTNVYFKGFSTVGTTVSKQRTLYDIDLINRDLMNHFMTRPGERTMRPTWGCGIWNYLMEPLTASIRDSIVSEALAVCQADSRLNVLDIQIYDLDQGIRVEIQLEYTPLAVIDTFSVMFEQRTASIWNGGTDIN